MVVVSGSGEGVAACAKDTATLVMNQENSGASWSASSDAVGQSISYGSDWQLYSLYISFSTNDESGVATVRIGTALDLSSPIEEWTNIAVDGAGSRYVELVSVQNDVYSASTTYYVGIIETTSDVLVRYVNSNDYAGGQFYDGTAWVLDTPNAGRDLKMNVYKTTVTPCE